MVDLEDGELEEGELDDPGDEIPVSEAKETQPPVNGKQLLFTSFYSDNRVKIPFILDRFLLLQSNLL